MVAAESAGNRHRPHSVSAGADEARRPTISVARTRNRGLKPRRGPEPKFSLGIHGKPSYGLAASKSRALENSQLNHLAGAARERPRHEMTECYSRGETWPILSKKRCRSG